MMTHSLDSVVARQKQNLIRDLLAISVLVVCLALAIFSVVGQTPITTDPGQQPTTHTTVEDSSPAAITSRQIDDTPHYL